MTSPVDTSVKFFNEKFPSAPVLNGVIGSLITLLDACLVDGFGSRTPSSVTVLGGVATINVSTEAKNLNMINSVILFEGATGSYTGLNGEQKITGATSTTLTFATALANGTVSGTLSFKTAPAGWTKVYSGTNKAVYASTDPESTGVLLRVDDTGTTETKVRGYLSMSDVDTGTGDFPQTSVRTDSQSLWQKSTGASASPNPWDIFADSRAFYFCPSPQFYANPNNYVGQSAYMFGDAVNYRGVDAYCAALTAMASAQAGATAGCIFTGGQAGTGSGTTYWARSYTGLGVASQAYFAPEGSPTSTHSSGTDSTLQPFPSIIDGALRLSKIHAVEGVQTGTGMRIRGEAPGVYYALHSGAIGQSFPRHSEIALGGRVLRAIPAGAGWTDAPSSTGAGFIDVVGPWR